MKVADFIVARYSDVEPQIAAQCADTMRDIMSRDLEEEDIALEAALYNMTISSELLQAAWEYMETWERAAWKKFVNYDEFLRNESSEREKRDRNANH